MYLLVYIDDIIIFSSSVTDAIVFRLLWEVILLSRIWVNSIFSWRGGCSL
jgi:hypothetical protein